MLYPVLLNESWPDCFNQGIVVFMSSEDPDLWRCNYPNQSGRMSKMYKDKERFPIGVHITN